MAIKRDVKTLAGRLDRTYFERQSTIRRIRVLAIVVCVAAGLGWWAMAGGVTEGELYNPGHVSGPHAAFESNCAACHSGNGKGGFFKTVSDTSCLSCHDGSIHHVNQKLAAAHADIDPKNHVMAVADSKHPFGATSASCVSCHVEHRGPEALRGTSDANCIACHGNIQNASMSNPHSADKIVAFTVADHPEFGRKLVQEVDGAKRPFDPTVLEFNHRKHLALEQFSSADSCVKCHAVDDVPATQPAGSMATAMGSGKYIRPIDFNAHCAGCHQIAGPSVVLQTKRGPRVTNENLLAETPIPHVPMDAVRAYAAAHIGKSIADKGFADARALEDFVKKTTDKLIADAGKAKLRDGAWTGDPAKPAAPTKLSGGEGQGAMADLYAHAIATSAKGCVLCHSLEQANGVVQTVSTKIPDSPRRWFASSEFDHRAHRAMNCVECHANFSPEKIASVRDIASVPELEKTSFISSPGLTWQQTVQSGDTFTTRARSCVECHHAGKTARGTTGVASNCVSCHQFHDRGKER